MWTRLRKENLKRETEPLLIVAQNNALRTNHIKARIDKTQQNRKYMLYADRDKTIWEMCKKLKFDHTNKWCMNNPESVLENDTHKLLGDFEIQTDPLI